MAERKVSVRLGVVGGKQVEDQLRRIGATGSDAFRKVGRDGAQAFGQIERASGSGRAAIANTAFQIQDLAVQIAGGTSASRALAQQLPQLLGGLGLMGAVAGAAAAIFIPFAASLFDTADATAAVVEEMLGAGGSIGAVESAVSALEATQRAYNAAISQTGGASSSAAALVIANSAAEFEARKQILAVELELLRIRRKEGAESATNLRDGIAAERNNQLSRIIGGMQNDIRFTGTDRAGGTLSDYVNIGPGSVAESGVTPDMVEAYREGTKLDRLALQKLDAENTLADLAISNAEELMTTTFEQVAAGAEAVVPAAGRAGRAVRQAGQDAGEGGEAATAGWALAVEALDQYAASARDIGRDIGASLVGAFRSAEDAIGNFVKTGKLDFSSLVTSMIADLAKLAARRFILGPLAGVLSGALGSGAVGQALAGVFHEGGMVGARSATRAVPAAAFLGAPRMHSGGWAGLAADEVPAILQRGERVLSRDEARGYGQGAVNVTIQARDAQSFRQSRSQVAADIARAVQAGRRNL
ncbi:phage tail tape measure C-terminal domain-containing protein [Phenylobacterium sp.]|uniref:phage tail tape measure C-terminal domain-containing protein n=1 Tax=Phenylobacterium sp. TaxID=1871053 RepID=UPI0025D9F1BE|nr:phage tail tape measure C-terminal domain-containing protein [Phenylobacterium sp.]